MSRYNRRQKAVNDSELYRDYLKDRGRRDVEQYRTPMYRPIAEDALRQVETHNYIFNLGDAYWKYSSLVYGDPQYWWVIASFNRKPSLSSMRPGDIVRVPVSLVQALEVLE